jgi:stage II sporulation protein D
MLHFAYKEGGEIYSVEIKYLKAKMKGSILLMKKFCLFLSMVVLLLTLSGINGIKTYAVANPSVKIGLYYKSTAKSQIEISADKGVAFSAYDSAANKYYPVYNSGASEVITVRKDSYYLSSGLQFTPVASTANPTSGPFHIQISGAVSTYNDALILAQGYSQKGISAYPVYTDSGWFVWTGFYINKTAADAAITSIKTKLGESTYTVISQVDTRIYGVNSLGEVKFMFASAINLLRGKSLSADNPNPIKIGTGKLNSFRGEVEFLRKTESDMTIINVLPLEEYLYGVVPNEIPASSGTEALKAQALAARTYTYKSLNKHASNGFNLCSTTDCQAYNGYASENTATNKAVDDTKDMVVTYNGSLAETLYFSSSGGMTEAAVNVWGTDFPYLQSVSDEYETGKYSNYNWNITLTKDQISQKLNSYGLGTVTGIQITKYSAAGRAVEIIVKGTSKPEGVTFTKDKCRTFLSLYSQWYTIKTNADVSIYVDNQVVTTPLSQVKVITAAGETTFTNTDQQVTILGANGESTTVSAVPTQYSFTGKGWGHAVGMSQDGAIGYAKAGYTYQQIIEHYYPGTTIKLWK